jgi:hypothetical protein
MPRGPKGEKRPADVIGNATKVMRIATGEEEEELDFVLCLGNITGDQSLLCRSD